MDGHHRGGDDSLLIISCISTLLSLYCFGSLVTHWPITGSGQPLFLHCQQGNGFSFFWGNTTTPLGLHVQGFNSIHAWAARQRGREVSSRSILCTLELGAQKGLGSKNVHVLICVTWLQMEPQGWSWNLLVDARRDMNRWDEKRRYVVAKMNKKMKPFQLNVTFL